MCRDPAGCASMWVGASGWAFRGKHMFTECTAAHALLAAAVQVLPSILSAIAGSVTSFADAQADRSLQGDTLPHCLSQSVTWSEV